MKKTIRKSISLLLALCMVMSLGAPVLATGTSTPEQTVVEENATQMVEILPQEEAADAELPTQEEENDAELLQADADYVVTFDTAESRGGWAKDTGPGSIAFTDGVGAAGFATISVGGNNSSFVANDAPLLKNGFVEADITPIGTNKQFALAFRYVSATSYVAICHDSGWFWIGNGGSKWSDPYQSTEHAPVAGTKFNLRIEFVEELVRVLVDGEEIFYGVLPSVGNGNSSTAELPTGAGKCGFRTWGSGNNNSIKLDNVRMGALTEIIPTQHAITVVNGTATPTTAIMGTEISVTANEPEGAATFRSWSSSDGIVFNDAVNPTTTFIMPGKAVTVKATYNKPGAEGGLVLHSTFDADDRSATEVFNLVDSTHKGVIGGTVTFEPGVRGDAVKIYNAKDEGTATNHVSYGTEFDTLMGTENFTVAAWIKSEGTNQDNAAIISNKDYTLAKNNGFVIPFLKGIVKPNFGDGTTRLDNVGGRTDKTWQHIVVTVDRSGSMSVYQDGELQDADSMAALRGKDTSTGLPFILGGDGKKNWSGNSTLDELRIYDKSLTQEEVANLFTTDGGALVALGRMEKSLEGIRPSDRIPAEAIAAFKVVLAEAKETLKTLTDSTAILSLMADLQSKYDTFLEGTGHLAKFIAISDVHAGSHTARDKNFVKAMEDMWDVAPDAIAMLNGGDFAESNDAAQEKVYKLMADSCPYEDGKVVIALGNHDVRASENWHSNPSNPSEFTKWPAYKDRYLRLNAPYMPAGNDKVYFSKELDGYTFVVLNTELGLKDDIYLSDAQISWFEETMKTAYETNPDKPVFIMAHQALGETHWPNPTEYPFSPQSINADAQVKEIMRKYPVGMFLSGHLHNGFGYSKQIQTDYGALIDLPSLLTPDVTGYGAEGTGYVAYIYENEVLWRARNFLTKEWLPEYDITLAMADMPKLSATIEDDEATMIYSTGAGKVWSREAPYHAATMAWPTTDATQYPSVSLTFDGTGITLYGHKIANGATMSVTVDGEDAGTADFYAPTVQYNADSAKPVPGIYGIQASAKVFEVSGLERGEHTVVLTMTNTKNDAAQPEGGVLRAAIDYAKIDYKKGYPAGTSFYVDSEGGNDDNEGTSANAPWKTLAKVNALTLKPGDKVLLKAGSVFEAQSLSLRGSGSASKPIAVDMYNGATIGAAAGAKPHVKANGVAKAPFTMGNENPEYSGGITASYSAIAYGLHIKNMSYITVKNLEITNTNGQDMTVDKANGRFHVGVVVETESGQGLMSGIHLDGLYVHDVNGDRQQKTAPNGGIYFITTAPNGDVTHPTRYDDISVQNCTVADVSRTGISVGSSHSARSWEKHPGGMIPQEVKTNFGHTNVLIKNNFVQNAGGDAIVPQFCIAPRIEYNVSDHASQNSGKDGDQYNAAIWPWRCEDALFQFNEAFSTKNNGDGQAYDCDSSRGTTYQYNYSHDNEGGFMLLCQSQSVESTVRYNISQNDHDSIFLLSNTTPADIYNNTFYIGPKATRFVEGGSPSILKNNIFYNASGKPDMAGWGNFTYENNLFYGFNTMPNDAKKIVADPMFVDAGKGGNGVAGNSAIDTLGGYELMAGSPAIGAGLVIANNGGRDYAGNPVSATEKPNIGALEGVSTQILVEKVELDQESLALVSNGSPNTATLVATVTPETATNTAVAWSSSDEAIATVDANGVVTAKAGGTAIITVTTENRKLTDACTVTVTTINTGSSTPAPKPEPPKTDVETGDTVVEIPVKPTVSGDKATANISTKTVTAAVDAAVKAAEQGGTNANVEITVSAPKDAKTVELSLPKEAVNAVATGKTECLIISSPVAEISLDSKALSAIAEAAGGTVKIAVSKMETKAIDATEQGKIGAAPVFDLTITSGTTAISDFKGGAAVITVPHTLAEGQDGKFVAVWYLADGKLSHVEGAYAEGMTTFTVGHFSRYAIGYLPFTDVAPGWYYESVVYAYNHEIFGGVGANTFAPQDSMTRAMLVTVLARLDGQDTTTGESWDTVGVAWAKENDISDGSGLEQAISREQLAVMLYRYAKAEKTEADLTDFSDTGSVSAWAAEAMSWAVKSGILNGSGGKLTPNATATRAEVATMLQRFVEQQQG